MSNDFPYEKYLQRGGTKISCGETSNSFNFIMFAFFLFEITVTKLMARGKVEKYRGHKMHTKHDRDKIVLT